MKAYLVMEVSAVNIAVGEGESIDDIMECPIEKVVAVCSSVDKAEEKIRTLCDLHVAGMIKNLRVVWNAAREAFKAGKQVACWSYEEAKSYLSDPSNNPDNFVPCYDDMVHYRIQDFEVE